MVKAKEARIATTTTKIAPKIVVLRLKALLRAELMKSGKEATILTEKDIAGKAIIDSYNLDLRGKLNAWECWRELYYTFYVRYQEIIPLEQAIAPFDEQVFDKQPFN